MSMTCAASGDHVDVSGLCCHRRPCWWCHATGGHVDDVMPQEDMLISVVCAAIGPRVDDVMPKEIMLKFVIHAAARDQIVVYSPCWHWNPCGSPWFVQLLDAISKEASFSVLLMTHKWEWETLETSATTSPPQAKRKHQQQQKPNPSRQEAIEEGP